MENVAPPLGDWFEDLVQITHWKNHEAAADRTLLQGHSHWSINILYNSTSGIHSQYHVKIKKEISKPREMKLRAMNQISKTWKLIVCFDVFSVFLF